MQKSEIAIEKHRLSGMLGRYLEHRGEPDPQQGEVWVGCVLTAYRETTGEPTALRRVRVLEEFAERAVMTARPDDLIHGSQRFWQRPPGTPEARAEMAELGWAHDIGHLIHDYGGLVREGIGARLDRIKRHPESSGTALTSMARALRAFQEYIRRHADWAAKLVQDAPVEWQSDCLRRTEDLRAIERDAPETLAQALQLVWLVQTFLHAENPATAISFGRLDRILWPFARADLAAGRLDSDELRDLIAAFCLRCCECGESQNLTVGGQDEDGVDMTNPLSILFPEVVGELRLKQPSLSVRVHPNADPALLDAACRLTARGLGQPAFINDEPAIKGLEAAGIPHERACDFGIVGCYEPSPQGDTHANTVAMHMFLTDILAEYVSDASPETGEVLREGFLGAVRRSYDEVLSKAQMLWDRRKARAPSPFGSALLDGCIDSACDMSAAGARFSLYGINIHGLGDTVDSIHVVEEQVFGKGELTWAELSRAMADDFPDEAFRQRLESVDGRYGTDDPRTNELAAWLSEAVATMVLDSRMEHGVRPYPALFKWQGEVHNHRYPGPDGRRRSQDLAFGVGPSPRTETSPTAILNSASHIRHDLCGCGNPLGLRLPASDLAADAGADRARALVKTYFEGGGFHLHFNVEDAETLREAKADPDTHRDLLVRISGLSARFVTLAPDLQDVLIHRADAGL